MAVVCGGKLGCGDGAGGVDAVVQGCEPLASCGLDREHAGLGGDGLAGGEPCGPAGKLGCGAGYEIANGFGLGDGGENIGMGGTAACADAGLAFELGGGECGIAFGELGGGEGQRLFGGGGAIGGGD